MTRSAAAAEWADLPNQEVEGLIGSVRAEGWSRGLEPYAVRAPFFVQRLRNEAVGNWHVLLTMPSRSRTLDVGCGFGALPAGMSACYARSVGMEMLPERLRLARLRRRGTLSLVRGDGHALPFRARALDVVTMNGVLEWAAHHADGDPEGLQLGMLREARRVLARDGALAVAIENRFALETLLGMRDTHTGLHLLPALPRGLARRWSRVRRGADFRTYLYSRSGYQALFHRAGFQATRVLDLVSSYNDYDFIVVPADATSYRLLWKRRWVRSFARGTAPVRAALASLGVPWLGELGYAYLVVGTEQPTALDSAHPVWQPLTALGFPLGSARFAATTTRPGVLAIVTHDGVRISGMVVLAREEAGERAWEDLRSVPLREHVRGHLQPLGELGYHDWRVSAYRCMAGA